jgi:uncharacterized repeat protein (TIGR01451 family)
LGRCWRDASPHRVVTRTIRRSTSTRKRKGGPAWTIDQKKNKNKKNKSKGAQINNEQEEEKKMKKKMMILVTVAMMVVVLAAGTAHAGTRANTSLTNAASADSVAVGDQVTFVLGETNNESFAISPQVKDFLPAGVQFVSATSSQGQCSFIPGGPNGSGSVECDIGTLPPGATAFIDVVVVPTQPGTIVNDATDLTNQASASVEVHPAPKPPAPHGKAVAVAGGAVAVAG